MTVPDRIERTVTIQAARSTVWHLVAQPGWWINTGGDDLVEAARDGRPVHRVDERQGRAVVTDETLGEFPLVVEASDEPHHIAYRWAPWALTDDSTGTLVEFTLTGPDAGPTTVTVVESGLTASDPAVTQAEHDEHERGWELEMAALVTAAEL